MDYRDVEALYNYLYRLGCLDYYDRPLIEDAIIQLREYGNEYKAQVDLKTLASNLRANGYNEEARSVDRLVK